MTEVKITDEQGSIITVTNSRSIRMEHHDVDDSFTQNKIDFIEEALSIQFCGDGIDSRLYEVIDELELIDSVSEKLIQKLRDIQDDLPCDCEYRGL